MLGRFGLIAMCITTAITAGSAPAQTGDPARVGEAAQTLSAKIDAATISGIMVPRINDPDNLVRNAFDRGAIRGLTNDLLGIVATCQSVVSAYSSYMTYITKRADGREFNSLAQRERLKSLQDETTLATTAADLCGKRILMAVTVSAEKLPPGQRDPARIAAATKMRAGMAALLLGTIEALSVSDLRPGNRDLLHESIMEMADVGADAMTLVQRADIRAKIDLAIKASPASSTAMLKRLRTIYSRVSCTGLCAGLFSSHDLKLVGRFTSPGFVLCGVGDFG